MKNEYKFKQLMIMRNYEERQPEEQKYGAHLSHWSGKAAPINIDEGALQLLIDYYGGFKDVTGALYFDVNNGMTMFCHQAERGGNVFTGHFNGDHTVDTSLEHGLKVIPPERFVMLLNLYWYVINNDIRNSFINPNGSKEESL